MINWNATKEETETICKIVDRYQEFHYSLAIPQKYQRPRMDICMDIEAVHCNGNPLRLLDLLNADDLNFRHDLLGIQQNLDRATGKLLNCFVPRYSLS